MDFIEACGKGDLKKAKEIFEKGNINIYADNECAFRWACENGHLEVAKWLIEISETKLICGSSAIASQVDSDPRSRSRIIDIHACDENAFRYACWYGHLHIAKWLLEISVEKKFGIINIHTCNEFAFRYACCRNHFEVAKWLIEISETTFHELGIINIHIFNEEPFRWVCVHSYLEIAKWLLYISKEKGLGDIDIYVKNEELFRTLCVYNNLKIARWLLTLYTRKKLINLKHSLILGMNLSLIKDELETRKKTNIELILYLHSRKFKLLDIHAIAIVWRDYL